MKKIGLGSKAFEVIRSGGEGGNIVMRVSVKVLFYGLIMIRVAIFTRS